MARELSIKVDGDGIWKQPNVSIVIEFILLGSSVFGEECYMMVDVHRSLWDVCGSANMWRHRDAIRNSIGIITGHS